MPSTIHILGIRHHGPGSARLVEAALAKLTPDAMLIEGPPDAADVLAFAAREEMKPPVALLVYDPETPSAGSYYPFAEFSPEWRAIRWGLAHGAEVRFIDLPFANSGEEPETAEVPKDEAEAPREAHPTVIDPLDALAEAAGHTDGEAWWNRLIEERRGESDPMAAFDSIREAMGTARAEIGERLRRHGALHEARREAYMRKCIRAAVKQGFARIAVVCGAWHAPVLTGEAIARIGVKADDEVLRALPKRKSAATWIPWTYDRLAAASGYGAGVASPGWYEHLWVYHDRLAERWLTLVARFMRDEGLDASPAGVIESVRLAESLAAMRGRSIAGLEELSEATEAVLCHGNPAPMAVIARRLIVGDRLGEIPDDAPSVPLQRDLAGLQKRLRMKVTAVASLLDLDQRETTDLERSRLLHRLAILGVPWGVLEQDQRQRASTFHEVWKLQWRPELAVAVIEAARWGNTVESAAAACVGRRAAEAKELAELTTLLDHVLLADLPSAVNPLVARIQELSAVAAGVGGLMDALPPLARVLRYGNVRGTDAALVEPLFAGVLARICAGLLPACGSLDDDAAAEMRRRVDAVSAALGPLGRDDYLGMWHAELARVGATDVHGLVAGRAWRLLVDAHAAGAEDAAARVSLALSPGNDPEKSSAWIEGFLAGSGAVLVHDEALLAIIDAWVCSLPAEVFERVCPIARRTFSTFEPPERRMIGERLRKGLATGGAGGTAGSSDPGLDSERVALVEPVLRMILGEDLP